MAGKVDSHSSLTDAGHRASLFDADFDIAGPMEIVITTPATGSYWLAEDVVSASVSNVVITEDVTIGAAGTALVLFGRKRQGDYPDEYAVACEYGGTYTGGTYILTKVEIRGEPGDHFLMKQSTSYLITVTSKADNNYASCVVWVWEGGPTDG